MVAYRLTVVLIALAGLYAFYRLGPGSVSTGDLRSAVGVLVGASASILGFLVASGALLYSVASTTLARNLQRTGHFQALLEDLFVCAGAFFLALVVAAVSLFVPDAAHQLAIDPHFSRIELAGAMVAFTQLIAYMLLLPVGHKMWLLLSNIHPGQPNKLE